MKIEEENVPLDDEPVTAQPSLEEEGEQAIKEYLAEEQSKTVEPEIAYEPEESTEPIELPDDEPIAPMELPESSGFEEDDEGMGAPGPDIPTIEELDVPAEAFEEPKDPNKDIVIPQVDVAGGVPQDAIIDKTEIVEATEDEHDEEEPILIGDECDDYLLDPFSTTEPTSIINTAYVGESPKLARADHKHAGLPALPGEGTWVLTINGATGVMAWVLTGTFACP